MSTLPNTFITPEEYLDRERKAETRSEYFRGEIFAMAGASLRHTIIVGNLFAALHQLLRNKACSVASHDLRIAVTSDGLFTYPDIAVVCGPPAFIDNRQDTVTNPIVIIEVLSESTKDYDRGQKFESYRTLPSLMEYLTVAQDKIHVEHYVRQADQRWILTEYRDANATVTLPSVDAQRSIADMYEKVDLAGV